MSWAGRAAAGAGATWLGGPVLHVRAMGRAAASSRSQLAVPGLDLQQAKQLTSLWAGYGTIHEATKVASDDEGEDTPVIIKKVAPPVDSGVSHERKLRSYQVEAAFYQHLSAAILAAQDSCHIPRPLLVLSDLGGSGGQLTLVLEDLRGRFPARAGGMDLAHAEAALTWLAAFHAHFWEQPLPEEVWPQGCYWHLETRQEEFEAIPREWQALKQAAHAIDARLQGAGGRPGQHRTLCHGDFKEANILFSRDGPLECAAYDFQYLGGGFGVKDVAYLLCSSVKGRVVEEHETALLAHYRRELCSRLPGPAAQAYTADVMQEHFKLAVCDYMRFMAGWGCWGNSSWVARRAKQYLAELEL